MDAGSLKSLFLFPILFLLAGSIVAQTSTEKGNSAFRIGVSTPSFGKVNRNDAAAALKAWGDAVIKERNMTAKATVKLYDRFGELREDFLGGRLDAVSTTAMDFPRLSVSVDAVFVLSTDVGVHVRYALVVPREGGIETLPELRGRRVVVYTGQRMELAGVWLDWVRSEIAEGAPGPARLTTAELENPSQAIFQVFFGQADAALVARESFALAREMNPQVGDQLKVLAVSSPLVPTFFLFNPSFQGPLREQMESAILELDATPGGRQVLTVFQSAKIEKRPFSVLTDTLEFLAAHRRGPNSGKGPGGRP